MAQSIKLNNDTYISNEALGEVLFEGTSNGQDIQLSKSVNNYKYIEIQYGSIYGGYIKSITIRPDVVSIVLLLTELDTSDANNYGFVLVFNKYTFDGNYLRYNGTSRTFKYENAGFVQDRNNPVYVKKVIGIN